MDQIKRPAGQGRGADEAAEGHAKFRTNIPRLQAVDDDAAIDVEGFKARLPAESFEARYVGHATSFVFNAPKIFLHFEISQFGEHHGVRVFRAFRIRRFKGRPGPNGGFVLHANGELYALLVRLLGVRSRTDRISLKPLRAMLFRIHLRTVATDYKQQPLPEHRRYSTIETIDRGE
ncbi:MAG: hypothetical protein WKH97_12720 [Casimicrobiaceae bacterium]